MTAGTTTFLGSAGERLLPQNIPFRFFAAAVLFVAGLYLPAIAVVLLLPLQAALIHLRCPSCDATTSMRGVTNGRDCLQCGQRLHY